MTRVRKVSLAVLAVLLALCLGAGLSSCGKKDETPSYGYGEEGNYYYTASDGSEFILVLQGGTIIQSYDGGGSTGTYEYDPEDGVFLVYEQDEETAQFSVSDAGLSVTYNDRSYLFLRYEFYTVSFVYGSEVLSTQSVLNGKAAQDPGDAGKDGYVFLGWYADSSFTERYGFDTSITSDTTIYARFVEAGSGTAEYMVNFDYTGETIETINGVVYNLPTPERSGYTFLGWWVSATNKASELTYKYEGETLCEDTTLFAFWAQGNSYMGASVRDDGITWENYNAAVTDIILRDESGAEIDRFGVQSTDGRYTYDFASLPAGKYTLVIQGGGIDETLVYVSHALARVSGFTVISGSILMYSPVENAERYYISVDCGNSSHDHTYIDNGSALYYDFSNCDMPATGITFTIEAVADGFYASESSFNFFLGLDKTEVTVEGDVAAWNKVAYALEYEVYVNGELVATVSGTEYDLSSYPTGNIEVSVRPVTRGYWSETSEIFSYTKTTLAAPYISGIENYTITWTAVDGATGYIVKIGDTETTVEAGTSLILSDDNYTEGLDSYEISVKATAADSADDSPYSEAITVTGTSVGSAVSYGDGTVTWQYSLSASEYRITVNDGDETIVSGTNSSPVTLTKSGNNEIKICFVDSDDEIYGTASITVYAYAIVFDARGGTAYMNGEVVDTIYVAKGDTVTLPEADMGAITADFVGWFTLPDMTGDPDAVDYMGDGVAFEDGTVFTGNSTMVLYACWLNPRLNIKLDAGRGTLTDENGETVDDVYIRLNGEKFSIAVPECDDGAYVFMGWYSGANGTGTRYTDEMGEAYAAFSDESVTTLYAYWAKVLSFSTTSYDGRTVMSVSKGSDIGLVEEVTVPETYTYNGTEWPVEVISSSTAFSSCTNLRTINLPDTIIYINITNNGYDSGAGVFNGTALENVNIYATGDDPNLTREIVYYSEGGVLFRVNTAGEVELFYYPYGRTDESYTIPATVKNDNEYEYVGTTETPVVRDVTAIGGSAFRGHKEIVRMTIPENITTLGTYIFYNCTSLAEVDFAGEVEKLEDYMFYGCSSLTEFELSYTVKEIGDSAFRNCTGLTTFTIPEGVTAMGTYVFYGCTNLKTVFLPGTLEKVNDYAFYNCRSLTGVDMPYGIKETGDYVFYGCSSLTSITLPQSLTYMGATFRGCTGLESITIPSSLQSFGTYTFYGCSSLTSITIPEGITTINEYDFENCTALTEVNLPDSLTTISRGAFWGCVSLMSIVIPKNVETIDTNAFYNCYKLVEIYNLSSISMTAGNSGNGRVAYYAKVVHTSLDEPSSIEYQDGFSYIEGRYGYTVIGYDGTDPNPSFPDEIADDIYEICGYAFYGNKTLESIVLPDSVETIGAYAFANCTGLKSVTLSEYIDEIPDYCFYGCTSLTKIVIPDNVYMIDNCAFYGCTSLVQVTLGRYLDYIEMEAFYECTKVAEVINLSSYVTVTAGVGTSDDGYLGYYAIYVCTSAEDSHLAYEDGFLSIYDAKGDYFLLGYYGTDNDLVFPDYLDGHTYEISDYMFRNDASIYSVTLGKGVTRVGDYAFSGCSLLESVTFGDGVEEIGSYAFSACESLTSVTFNAGLSTIGSYAFYECTALEGITFTDGVTSIGDYAFRGCDKLSSVTFGKGLKSIGDYAFYGLEELESVVFPDSLRQIGNYAFSGCTNLSDIYFPDGIEIIGRNAFSGTAYYTNAVNWDGGVFYIGGFLMEVDESFSGELIVKEGTTLIAGGACYGVTGITSVTLPKSVVSIGDYAFYGCTGLTSINIPEWLYYIGNSAFYNCSRLSIDLNLRGDELTIGSSAFRGTGVTSVTACFDYVYIGSNAFYNVTSLKSADFAGTQVMDLGNEAFYGCSKMTYCDVSGARGDWGTYMFRDCSSLTEFTVPGGVSSLGTYCFYGDTALKTLIIEEGVQELGTYMCRGCDNLETVYIPSTITYTDVYVFDSLASLKNVYLAEGLAYLGTYMIYKCTAIESITIPSTITEMGTNPFNGCTGIKEVTLTDGLTFLGSSMFSGCTALESINIPSSIQTINSSAFNNCTSLKYVYIDDLSAWAAIDFGNANANPLNLGASLYLDGEKVTNLDLPEGTTKIGSYAFYGFESATTITIPSTVTSIGNYAFYNTYYVTDIYYNAVECSAASSSNYIFYNTGKYVDAVTLHIGANVKSIPNYVFSPTNASTYSPNIKSVEFAEDGALESIGNYSFRYAVYLTSITIPDTVTSIGSDAFYHCEGLTSIVIPDSVTSLGTYAFEYCTGLESVTIGSGISSISNYAFQYCSDLESVVIPETVTSVGTYVFRNCTSLEWVVIGSNVTSIGNYAFNGCSKLSAVYFMGDETAWNKVSVGSNNSPLTSATVYYYSATAPAADGNFWYYDDGVPAVWKKD